MISPRLQFLFIWVKMWLHCTCSEEQQADNNLMTWEELSNNVCERESSTKTRCEEREGLIEKLRDHQTFIHDQPANHKADCSYIIFCLKICFDTNNHLICSPYSSITVNVSLHYRQELKTNKQINLLFLNDFHAKPHKTLSHNILIYFNWNWNQRRHIGKNLSYTLTNHKNLLQGC